MLICHSYMYSKSLNSLDFDLALDRIHSQDPVLVMVYLLFASRNMGGITDETKGTHACLHAIGIHACTHTHTQHTHTHRAHIRSTHTHNVHTYTHTHTHTHTHTPNRKLKDLTALYMGGGRVGRFEVSQRSSNCNTQSAVVLIFLNLLKDLA